MGKMNKIQTANKYMKRRSTAVIIRELQIKTRVRSEFTLLEGSGGPEGIKMEPMEREFEETFEDRLHSTFQLISQSVANAKEEGVKHYS